MTSSAPPSSSRAHPDGWCPSTGSWKATCSWRARSSSRATTTIPATIEGAGQRYGDSRPWRATGVARRFFSVGPGQAHRDVVGRECAAGGIELAVGAHRERLLAARELFAQGLREALELTEYLDSARLADREERATVGRHHGGRRAQPLDVDQDRADRDEVPEPDIRIGVVDDQPAAAHAQERS